MIAVSRCLVDYTGDVWTAREEDVDGPVPMYQVPIVFTAKDGRRRWAPVVRSGLARMCQVELRELLQQARPGPPG